MWLEKALLPILVLGPLVQVPSAFFLKSSHLILAVSAASALVTEPRAMRSGVLSIADEVIELRRLMSGSWLFPDVSPEEVRTARDSQTSYFFNFDYALIAAMSGLPSH